MKGKNKALADEPLVAAACLPTVPPLDQFPKGTSMRVFITGGTGLIGRRLARRLVDRGDQPVILSRQADKARLNPALQGMEVIQGDPTVSGGWEYALDGSDAVVNLAGQNIFAKRWTAEIKRLVRDSRVYATENVVAAMAEASIKPKVLVQASAVGYYGHHGDEILTESSPPGDDFMALVCREWEDASLAAENLGVRVARVRIGVVLSLQEGALAHMVPIFKYVPGGAAPVGSGSNPFLPAKGRQWMSWIHLEDIVGILLLSLDHSAARGPINGTAPQPERNIDFSRALAQVLRRGFWPPFVPFGPPDVMLGMILGEVAQVITKGQRVVPERAKALGYSFQYPDLPSALRQIFAKPSAAVDPRPLQPAAT
jgi:uncharacterized protein